MKTCSTKTCEPCLFPFYGLTMVSPALLPFLGGQQVCTTVVVQLGLLRLHAARPSTAHRASSSVALFGTVACRNDMEWCRVSVGGNSTFAGKKKMDEGGSANLELEEEIEELAKKLIELQKGSKMKLKALKYKTAATLIGKLLCFRNNSKNTTKCRVKTVLRRQQKVSLPFNSTREGKMKGHGSSRRTARFTDVELLKRKVEGLSKGKLLKRMEEEYGYMLSEFCFDLQTI